MPCRGRDRVGSGAGGIAAAEPRAAGTPPRPGPRPARSAFSTSKEWEERSDPWKNHSKRGLGVAVARYNRSSHNALSSRRSARPYEILAPIRAGGMGEVYKTRDSRLDRLVAIKISAAKFSERFEREARAVGSLNHPNICHLYDVGTNYLVMEFIDGSPLGQVENPRQLL